MVARARRVVNQSKQASSVCTDVLIKGYGYARYPWISAAARGLDRRWDYQTLNGGKVRVINHLVDNDPKHIAEGASSETGAARNHTPKSRMPQYGTNASVRSAAHVPVLSRFIYKILMSTVPCLN